MKAYIVPVIMPFKRIHPSNAAGIIPVFRLKKDAVAYKKKFSLLPVVQRYMVKEKFTDAP